MPGSHHIEIMMILAPLYFWGNKDIFSISLGDVNVQESVVELIDLLVEGMNEWSAYLAPGHPVLPTSMPPTEGSVHPSGPSTQLSVYSRQPSSICEDPGSSPGRRKWNLSRGGVWEAAQSPAGSHTQGGHMPDVTDLCLQPSSPTVTKENQSL